MPRLPGRNVARALIGPIGAIVAAAGLAGCDTLEVRPGAQGIFQALAPPTPAEAAAWAIDPYDANNRYRGTTLLANAPFGGEPPYLALYVDNADDPDPSVRAAAVRALAMHGDPSHVPIMVERLSDDDLNVRIEAARALQRLHDPAAVEPLLARLAEPPAPAPEDLLPGAREPGSARAGEREPAVRAEVASALGQYAQNRVVLALIGALADRSLTVNRNALRSLRTLTGQDFGLDRRAWQQWFNETDRPFAARAVYTYPVFSRPKRLHEYLPFIPGPPNETPAPPVGYPRPGLDVAADGEG